LDEIFSAIILLPAAPPDIGFTITILAEEQRHFSPLDPAQIPDTGADNAYINFLV